MATHEVFNQSSALVDYNPCLSDPLLCVQLDRHAPWARQQVQAYAAEVGGPLVEAGFLAERNPPQLHTHDRFGHRIDSVEFHPAWHQLMATARASGWPTLPWTDSRSGAQVARAAMQYLHHQADSGSGCPLTMTFAAVPVISRCESLTQTWLPGVTASRYDARDRPYFEKAGLLIGMGMTEKQGGSDVRANTSTAELLEAGGSGTLYRLRGHKWFMSAPMCDAFLVLAQADAGLSCFLMPRWRPDGERNDIRIQRLKNKLGNRSNASAEVEFDQAWAWLIGEEGTGIQTIIEMVALTRFDCMVGSAGIMRQALVQALHHCNQRQAFGKRLIQQPLMQNVLADLVLESQAAMLLAMRVARALEHANREESEQLLLRLVTPVGKYWVCKRAPAMIYEAMECLGGNGYVEESLLPRLYREAPVNAIWEGSGNIQCLDVLRVLGRNPECLDALWAELDEARGLNPAYDRHLQRLDAELQAADDPLRARRLVELMARALQAGLMLRELDAVVAEAFCERFLGEDSFQLYGGQLDPDRCRTLITGAWPDLSFS